MTWPCYRSTAIKKVWTLNVTLSTWLDISDLYPRPWQLRELFLWLNLYLRNASSVWNNFKPIYYATDPDCAGVCVDFEDEELLMILVCGTNIFYEVCYYLGEWFCQPCQGFYYRGFCSHVDRGKCFISKRGALNLKFEVINVTTS